MRIFKVVTLRFILRYSITQSLSILYDSKPGSGKFQSWASWLSDIWAVSQLLGESFGLKITAAALVTRCSGCVLQNEKGDGRAVLGLFLCLRKRNMFTRSTPYLPLQASTGFILLASPAHNLASRPKGAEKESTWDLQPL